MSALLNIKSLFAMLAGLAVVVIESAIQFFQTNTVDPTDPSSWVLGLISMVAIRVLGSLLTKLKPPTT